MKEELVFLGIFITAVMSCPEVTEDEVGCVSIKNGATKDDAVEMTRCYYLYKQKQTDAQTPQGWTREEASEICSCQKKMLPGRMTDNARVIISATLNKTSPPLGVWLMGQKKITANWVNNQMVSMETSDLLNKTQSHECAYVVREDNRIKLKPEMCSAALPVICQKENCESNECLSIKDASVRYSWFEGRSACRNGSMDILSFHDSSGLTRLQNILQPGVKYWVGIRKAIWLWNETTEIDKFYWSSNKPSLSGGACLALTQEGRWEDVTCSSQRYALCWQDKEKSKSLKPEALGSIIGGTIAAVVVAIIIIVALIVVLLRRKRKPLTESDVDHLRRKTHVKKRDREVKTEYGVRHSDISDNLNVEAMDTTGLAGPA